MPSLQHTLFRFTTLQMRYSVDMHLSQVPRIRKLLEISSIPLYLPLGVSARLLRIGDLLAEWYTPRKADPKLVLLYLHGGGYCVGSILTHRGLVARLAQEAGIQAMQIDYRLAPEHPFPAALEDAVHAYQWLLQQGYEAHQILLAGDSAGGGLAVALQLTLREMGLPLPVATLYFSPWVDIRFSTDSARTYATSDPIIHVAEVAGWGEAYAGSYPLDHPMISPVLADLTGLPPALIQASDSEVLTDDARMLQQGYARYGSTCELQLWPEMLHVWQMFWRMIPEAKQAIAQGADFLRQQGLAARNRQAAA
ncbi:MAG: alpha/beta hydrolase [Bacteroidia bacterium]